MATALWMPRLNTWLEQVGFTRGNPFATNEADRESALPEYFVDTGEYEIIKGHPAQPCTTLVFAPRGGGKSAHRVMLASQCRPLNRESGILAIPHTSFDLLLEPGLQPRDIVDRHVHYILRNGCETFIQACVADEVLAGQFPPAMRSLFKYFCEAFHPDLLGVRSLKALFDRMGLLQVSADWSAFQQAVQCRKGEMGLGRTAPKGLTALLAKLELQDVPGARLLADLVDQPAEEKATFTSLPEIFRAFVDMARSTGLQAVYILVDRIDELPDTADDPQHAANLIAPLVAYLPLMETPGAAFKFFLPTMLYPYLMDTNPPPVRPDRLSVCQVEWDEPRLQQLLEERLKAYSEGKISSLAQISTVIDIDARLVKTARRSPRRLLVLGNKLFLAHCRVSQNTVFLTYEDCNILEKPTARVRLSKDRPIVVVEEEPKSLTSLEYKFLACLLDHKGRCGKETLADQVWGSTEGVSDQAISRLVLRLRQKIEADPSNPVHLLTERGSGFQLSGVTWDES